MQIEKCCTLWANMAPGNSSRPKDSTAMCCPKNNTAGGGQRQFYSTFARSKFWGPIQPLVQHRAAPEAALYCSNLILPEQPYILPLLTLLPLPAYSRNTSVSRLYRTTTLSALCQWGEPFYARGITQAAISSLYVWSSLQRPQWGVCDFHNQYYV